MKYIERFIKNLIPNITEKKSDISNSVYYKLSEDDRVFSIRCSDHFSPISGFKTNDIEIVKILGKEDFIVLYCGYNAPMLKNRKEVKDFISIAYDIYRLKSMVKETKTAKTDKKTEDTVDELPLSISTKWKDYADNIVYIAKGDETYSRHSWTNYMRIISNHCKLPLSKSMKAVLREYYNDNTFSNDEMTTILFNLKNLEPKRSLDIKMVRQYCCHMLTLKEKKDKKA